MASNLIEQFIAALGTNRRNTYSFVAALTFCAYDIMLTSRREIKYIWGSKLSPVVVLYYIVRYYGLINLIIMLAVFIPASENLSAKVCHRYFFWGVGFSPTILVIALDTLLLLRIFALYKRSKPVFVILLVLVLGDFAATLWANITLAKDLVAGFMVLPAPWQGCASQIPKLNFMLAVYIPNFALSLLFLAMTLWKLVENHQEVHGKLSWRMLRSMQSISPLLLAFVRDGSIFFALTSVNTFIQIMTAYVVKGLAQAAFLPWIVALYSYAGSHLILNLRAAGTKGNTEQTWNETLSIQHRSDAIRRDEAIVFA